MTVRLVDTHCHLMLADFNGDLPQVLERARRAGVTRILVPGIDVETSRQAVALAQRHHGLFAAVGIHPHHATTWSDSARDELRRLAAEPGVVAIGEIGLDYYRDRSPRPAQRRALEGQLAFAAELGLPVVVHNREATADVLAALQAWSSTISQRLPGRSGVLHAFSGDEAAAEQATQAGFYLGVAGPLTYRNAQAQRSIAAALPRERLLVETDAPYLTPHPYRGRRNEPAYVRLVAEEAAHILDTPCADFAGMTSRNAETLFGWNHASNDSHLL